MRLARAVPGPLLLLIRLAFIGASFTIAYRGQRLLETQEDLRRGGLLFLVAALLLVGAWFLSRTRLATAGDEEPPGDTAPGSPLRQRVPAWAARSSRALATYWPVLAVVALAAALRFYQLGSLPFGVTFDEAQNGLEARRILHDPSGYHPIFIPGVSQLPALFFYVFAAAMKVLGEEIFALRTTTAISGVLTVAALYLLGRELFGHWAGVLAAFLLAVMRWHLNFSRITFHGIFGPLFMVLALYFIVRGFKGRGWLNYAVAGVLLGIGLQSYYAFTLVPLVVVLYWAHHALFAGRRKLVPLAGGLLLVGVTSVLVVLPLLRYVHANPDVATQRAKTVSITTDRSFDEVMGTVRRSTKEHALMFNVQGDFNGRHNLPPLPMLDRFTAMFFLLGIALALTRPHDSRYFLLLVWLAALVQPGIWSIEGEAPQGYRAFMVTPVIALLAALPLMVLADTALEMRRPWSAAASDRGAVGPRLRSLAQNNLLGLVAAGGLLFLLAQVAYLNYNTFFNKQLRNAYVWAYFEPVETITGREMDRLGPEVLSYASATIANPPTTLFLAPDGPLLTSIVLPRDLPFQGDQDVVVFLDGRDQRDSAAFPWIQRLYPEATFTEYHPPGEPQTTVLHEAIIPAELIRASYGVDATYRPEGSGVPLQRREAALAADWRRQTPVPLPFTAQWSTTIKLPRLSSQPAPDTGQPTPPTQGLRVEAPGAIRLQLDGAVVAEGSGRAEVTGDLAFGLHELLVEVQATAQGAVRLLWLSEGEWVAVPESAVFRLPVGPHGLTGTYYALESETSPLTVTRPPLERRVDPYISYRYHVNPIDYPGAFVVRWTGKLRVPEPGGYLLATDASNEVSLLVNGQPYLTGAGSQQGTTLLASGVHEIELRYAHYSGAAYVLFYWQPPAPQPRVIVPFENLLPQ